MGPYLGVFLKQHQFSESQIGFIVTIASLCALLLGIPLGVLIDKTPHKKALITFCIIIIVCVTLANYFYPHFSLTLLAQVSVALCAVCLAPALAAITLGIVGLSHYSKQVGMNEAYKHAGTAFSALLSFGFALFWGIGAIFVITALMGVLSLLFLSLIRSESINHKVARGDTGETKVPLWESLSNKSVFILGVSMFLFHLSNAYMLPLLSQRAHTLGIDTSGAYAAATILIAQSTMIVISLVCMKILSSHHTSTFSRVYFVLMWLCFVALIIRGCIAAYNENLIGMVIVQILDGIGAGITGVILPILVAIMLSGSGHINAALSCVMTFGSVGAGLSGSLGGFIAQYFGYFYAYITLACVALVGLVLWIASFSALKNQRQWA